MRLPQNASRFWRLLYVIITLLKPLFCRLQVEGCEHVPEEGGCIIASTHTHGPDYVILGYASPRQVYYMAKAEIFQVSSWLNKFLAGIGTFPVQRGRSDIGAIQAAERVVTAGHALGMFPEGTRSPDGALGKGKTGVARIAVQTGAPVVPAAVINAAAFFTQLGRRPHITVRFGAPIYLDPNKSSKVNTDIIMHAIAALLPPEQHGYYGKTGTEQTQQEAVSQLGQ